jgi:regulator of protease activity HflC (stomatin/prohibitin superfamily)
VADIFGLAAAIPVLAPLLAGASGVRFVQESQRGIKLRFGKARRRRDGTPRIVKPGFCLVLPTIHSLRRIHVRTQTIVLDPQQVILADHTVFNVGGLVLTQVIDDPHAIYNSMFEVDDVATSVEEYCAAALRDVLLGVEYTELSDPGSLADQVRDIVEPTLTSWGISLQDFRLTNCYPTPQTAQAILAETGTRFRAKALEAVLNDLNDTIQVNSTLAAALVGIPVAISLGDSSAAPSTNGSARSVRRQTVVNVAIGGGGGASSTSNDGEEASR